MSTPTNGKSSFFPMQRTDTRVLLCIVRAALWLLSLYCQWKVSKFKLTGNLLFLKLLFSPRRISNADVMLYCASCCDWWGWCMWNSYSVGLGSLCYSSITSLFHCSLHKSDVHEIRIWHWCSPQDEGMFGWIVLHFLLAKCFSSAQERPKWTG